MYTLLIKLVVSLTMTRTRRKIEKRIEDEDEEEEEEEEAVELRREEEGTNPQRGGREGGWAGPKGNKNNISLECGTPTYE